MHTALLFIDVQESFRHRPFWSDAELPRFLARSEVLLKGCEERGIPVLRILHTVPDAPASEPFSPASGLVRPLEEIAAWPVAATFHKTRHSALVGTGLSVWLQQRGINRLIIAGIRTEQCCETTTRHASDEGFEVDFVTEATLTFDMRHPVSGAVLSAQDLYERSETVLAGRFATICSGEEALSRVV